MFPELQLPLDLLPVLQAFPFAALIPVAAKIVGGLFSKKGKDKQAEGQHELGRADFERQQATQAARAQLVKAIFGGLGIGGSIDPSLMAKLGTPAAYPGRPSSGWQGTIGGALEGVSPYLAKGVRGGFENFGGPGGAGATPATDAADAGGLYGPPESPAPVEAETIGAGDDSDVDEYLQHFRGVSGASF